MPEVPIDLRSDTVTRPTPAMRTAIAAAEVGDDWAGEDPTVRALEEEVAARFGHEAAVYVPSGTMSNNIALRLLADRGEEVLADNDSHVVTYEMGGLAALGGIQTRTLVSTAGILAPETVAAQLRSGGENYARVTTRALAIENTHVRSGGRSWSLAEIDALIAVTVPAGPRNAPPPGFRSGSSTQSWIAQSGATTPGIFRWPIPDARLRRPTGRRETENRA